MQFLPQRWIVEFAKTHGFDIEGDININPETAEMVNIHMKKVVVTPGTGRSRVENVFSVGLRMINWRKKIEKYGLRREFKRHDYELDVTGNVSGVETWWFSRKFTGDDPSVLFAQARRYINEQYQRWLEWLNRHMERLGVKKEEKPREGLWKWALIIPAGMLVLTATQRKQ